MGSDPHCLGCLLDPGSSPGVTVVGRVTVFVCHTGPRCHTGLDPVSRVVAGLRYEGYAAVEYLLRFLSPDDTFIECAVILA